MSLATEPAGFDERAAQQVDNDGRLAFVQRWGWRANARHLASVLGCTRDEINHMRQRVKCRKLEERMKFAELFRLWNGRLAEDNDWPAPEVAASGRYEWLAPEQALLAVLVGQISIEQIALALTERLRAITGDAAADRSKNAVQMRMSQIGLQTSDVVGGITVSEAAREAGSLELIHHALKTGSLPAHRVGRLWVIPHEGWAAWKKSRVQPPEGFVPLRDYREPLGIKSDKLSEFARMGYVPSAAQFTPFAAGPSTKFGTWWVDKAVIEKMVTDRHAGLPMPWQGKPLLDNLRVTFRLWEQRKHPAECETCKQIWGAEGVPASFDEYLVRFPPLEHGAKRHLTRAWTPGLTIDEVAKHCGCEPDRVRQALEVGTLSSTDRDGTAYVSKTDATRWKARRLPIGGTHSWASLPLAARLYFFTEAQLQAHISNGTLQSRVGTDGAARGILYVLKQQCRELRERLGLSEQEAAARIGISIERLRVLLKGVDWRGGAEGIPFVTVQAVIKRHESRPGYTFDQAAEALGESVAWIQARVADGTVKVSRAPWDHQQLHLSQPMFDRLSRAQLEPAAVPVSAGEWVRVNQAALDAGVSNATMQQWGRAGEVTIEQRANGCHFLKTSVRNRARTYWKTVRYLRKQPPDWLLREAVQSPGG